MGKQETSTESAETKKHQNEIESISSFIPGIGNLIALCQSITGKTCFSQEELSTFDRSLSSVGLLFGGWAKVGKVTKGGVEGLEIIAKNNKEGREAAEELSRLVGAGKGISEIGGYKLSSHANARMIERGISFGQVENAIKHGNEFSYFHEGVWKTGYYDSKEGIFVGVKDIITTVINDVDSSYIENLKKLKP